jgi:hypothetical protein
MPALGRSLGVESKLEGGGGTDRRPAGRIEGGGGRIRVRRPRIGGEAIGSRRERLLLKR